MRKLTTKDRALALAAGGSSEFWRNKSPKCPHCGDDYDIERHDAYDLYDDANDHEVECPKCELTYLVRSHASYSFSTDGQDEE